MSKGLLKIRIFLQLFYCPFLQREANNVRMTKRTKETVLFCLKNLAVSQGKGMGKELKQ